MRCSGGVWGGGGGGDFTVFSREFLNRFPNEESKHWVVIFWSFWNACNLFLHEGVQLHPKQILDNGHRLLADFREANTSLHQVCSQIERIAGQAAGWGLCEVFWSSHAQIWLFFHLALLWFCIFFVVMKPLYVSFLRGECFGSPQAVIFYTVYIYK